MSVSLREPKQSIVLDKARIAAFKFEDNAPKGQRWIEVWIVLGYEDADGFHQQVDPETGAEVFRYLKLEHGVNPLDPTKALPGYDGASRFILAEHNGPCTYADFKAALYAFLREEEVPDPITGKPTKLLDAI